MSKAAGTRTASLYTGQVPAFQGRRLSRAAALCELAALLRGQVAREGAYPRHTLEKRKHISSVVRRQAFTPEMITRIWSAHSTCAGAHHPIISENEIPHDRVVPLRVGTEDVAGYRSLNCVTKSSTDNLDAAKVAAEEAWRELQRAR